MSTAAVAATAWGLLDYRAWTSLGPGGLPHTFAGWLKMTTLRIKQRDPLSIDPLRPLQGQPMDNSVLGELPRREGPRPRIAPHPVPHRQLNQHAPFVMRAKQASVFETCASGCGGRLHYVRSYFEKHNDAVTLRDAQSGHPDACVTCGEIAHIHPSDGSMHMILATTDARKVIEAGWGERHGLAGVALGLPWTYMMIYAPRDDDELRAIAQILNAAVSHMAEPVDPTAVVAAEPALPML